jgi:hypothetical protein
MEPLFIYLVNLSVSPVSSLQLMITSSTTKVPLNKQTSRGFNKDHCLLGCDAVYLGRYQSLRERCYQYFEGRSLMEETGSSDSLVPSYQATRH